jgi:nucleotide-binding universal stress UspA family protein
MVVPPTGRQVAGASGDMGAPSATRTGIARRRGSAQSYLETIALGVRQRGLRATVVVLTADDPAPAIVDLATLEEIDVVAKATHGWRYGSVADAVSRTAHAPVLLVRPGAGARPAATSEAVGGHTPVDQPAALATRPH